MDPCQRPATRAAAPYLISLGPCVLNAVSRWARPPPPQASPASQLPLSHPFLFFYMGVCPRGCASSGIGMWRQQRRRRRGIRGRVRRNQEELGHRFFGPAPQLNRPPHWSFFRLPPPPAPPPFPFALAKSFVSCVTVSVRSSRSFSNDADLALQYRHRTHSARQT